MSLKRCSHNKSVVKSICSQTNFKVFMSNCTSDMESFISKYMFCVSLQKMLVISGDFSNEICDHRIQLEKYCMDIFGKVYIRYMYDY